MYRDRSAARFDRGGGELRWMLNHRQLRTMRK